MNNNIVNLINMVAGKYVLNSIEVNELMQKFQNDNRDLNVIQNYAEK